MQKHINTYKTHTETIQKHKNITQRFLKNKTKTNKNHTIFKKIQKNYFPTLNGHCIHPTVVYETEVPPTPEAQTRNEFDASSGRLTINAKLI